MAAFSIAGVIGPGIARLLLVPLIHGVHPGLGVAALASLGKDILSHRVELANDQAFVDVFEIAGVGERLSLGGEGVVPVLNSQVGINGGVSERSQHVYKNKMLSLYSVCI